ncbi:MAG: circularly permuted type 2 ATP-grasp protein [Pseudomonadota bacterium]
MRFSWKNYSSKPFYDELIGVGGRARPAARTVAQQFRRLNWGQIHERQQAAELAIKTMGITFTVYAEGQNIDRAWPYDIIPRTIDASDWAVVERGLAQRLTALNCFIDDVYNDQKVFRDKIVPPELILDSPNYRAACQGMKPRFGTWAHICGTDLIRDDNGRFFVLEDNLRVPSGVSYMLENRKVTKRVFPELFESEKMRPIGEYTSALFDTLASLSPRNQDYPEVVVLTPGIYNAAYFEHSYLAQQMGAELVEGTDLYVADDDCVYMRTISGPERVDVIYRRVDDLFLDPETFNPDSQLGVPGLIRAWLNGNVALANAPGAGVADDKAVYTYVPDIIRYYLGEDPIIPNVETYRCSDKSDRDHVIQHLDKLVVKPANESGGYGMLMGPSASGRERQRFAKRIRANPRNYVAQPLISLSTCPTLCGDHVEPRHVDLRPFVLHGANHYVTPGGLTRVALQKGSFIVNSSQGGGSKDTWIVDGE